MFVRSCLLLFDINKQEKGYYETNVSDVVQFRRQEPQESEPVFTTAVYPISEEPQNTPDEYTGVPEYWYPTPDYTNDTDSDYYQTPSYFPDYSTPEYDSNYTNYPSYYNEVRINVCVCFFKGFASTLFFKSLQANPPFSSRLT